MFRIVRNSKKSGTPRGALDALAARLPPGWHLEAGANPAIHIVGPEDIRAALRRVERRVLTPQAAAQLPVDGTVLALVLAPFLSPRARQVLAQRNFNYADATGNVRLVLSRPAVFVETQGAAQDPDRVPRALHSLRGAAAGRVVRALCELDLPLGIRELAEACGASLGTVSRTVTFLESEAVLTRDGKRQVTAVDRPALLRRWAQDYGLQTSNDARTYLEPRGLSTLWPKLALLSSYAATGTLAGPGVAPTRLAMIFVPDAPAAAQTLGLVEAEVGANVLLLEPFDPVVFDRTRKRPAPGAPDVGLVVVSEAQAYVDLATGPGRASSEAEALLRQWGEADGS